MLGCKRPLSASLVMELFEQRAHLDRRHFARIRHDRYDRVALAVDLPGKDGRRRRAGSALRARLAALLIPDLYVGNGQSKGSDDPEDLFNVTEIVKGIDAAETLEETGCRMTWPA